MPAKGQLSGKTIILDPGHGGADSGAAWNGNLEKNFNLDMALRLKRMLEHAGAKVLMTRTKDEYSYLYYRSAFVNKYIVDLEIKDQEAQKKALTDEMDDKTAESLAKGKELDAKKDEFIIIQNRISQLQLEIQAKEADLAGAEANLGQLNDELDVLISQMNDMGYDSLEDLKNAIADLEKLLNGIEGLEAEISDLEEQIKLYEEESGEPVDDESSDEEPSEEESDEYQGLKKALEDKQKELDDAKEDLLDISECST
ncbi:MAG: hypothetical protein GX340_09720, partial [Clostridiales bacterium]|nr:hypothetical protein [Clostridiales bacterium]